MRGLSTVEAVAVEACAGEPMLDQVQRWAAINTGSRNLEGLAAMAAVYAEEFAALPGEVMLREPADVEAVDCDGVLRNVRHGQNLHVKVRPGAQVQLLFTGHMDTVYAVDHPFQTLAWREEGVLGGPGVADMKGGIAVMLAALKAVEASAAAPRL